MPNTFELLDGSTAFIESLRHALTDCSRSLYVQFSTFEGDASGQEFAEMLIELAQRGVDVCLTTDRYSDVVQDDIYPILLHRRAELQTERHKTCDLMQKLADNGIPVKRTAPMGPMGIYALYRDHKKMVVIDEKVAYVGGINVSDHNYAWHDFMVKVTGDLARDLACDYMSTWDGKTVAFDRVFDHRDFILNQCAGRYSIFEEILRMIQIAQETLVIESPYLMGDYMESAILQAAQRGVKVRLILPYHSNKLVYRIWARKMYRRFDHPNITIYGYRGEHDMTHAKLVIVDEQYASFGSLNMFELEGLTQKELNIFTRNAEFIAQALDFVEQDIQNSTVIAQPRTTFGRFTYSLLYRFFCAWTNRLVQNPAWRAKYC